MKFICYGCEEWHNDPCILDVGEEQYVSGEHMRCPFNNAERDRHYCKWEKYDDGKVANLQPTCNRLATDLQHDELPKLTAEVFDRPDCPEWAKYAAVDKCRNAMWYEGEPKVFGSLFWNSQRGKIQKIPGKFDASDWKNSLVERPAAKLPDWCKVGGLVWFKNVSSYEKIEAIKDGYVDCGVAIFAAEEIGDTVFQARLRPYNAGEVPDLPFEVTERNSNFRTTVVSCQGNKVWIAGASTAISTEELMRDFTAKGEPCGVLEHLRDGEWVK
jgi:hypothetical protein